MKTIWKYEFTVQDKFTLQISKGGQILSVQVQHNNACIWVLVDKDEEKEERYFQVFGTGHEIKDYDVVKYTYIGSFQLFGGDLVFHLFEYKL